MADPDTALNAAVKLLGGQRGHRLLGCDWGIRVSTPNDDATCNRQARQVVALHDGGGVWDVKVCEAHRDRLLAETNPHRATASEAPDA